MLMKHSMHPFKFVKKPNLPQSRAGVVAISEKATEAIATLNKMGIETLKISPDLRLPEPVNSHADLQLLHLTENTIIFQNEHLCTGESELNFYIRKISQIPGNKYPDDVRLNCAIIGNKIICNKKTIAREILEYAESSGLTVINVNQGYTRCSTCVVNENAIITDDISVFSAAQNFFDDALLISKNSIRLDGYDYGFIGGSCGKIDKDKIAFNGAIESHRDYKLIIDFLQRNNTECIELHRNRLTDIGGILPLTEI
jgi:hypothetical protein